MKVIFSNIAYPWHLKEAQQLHVALCQISPTVKSSLLAAEKSGIDIAKIFTEQAVYLVWAEILREASVAGQLRKLVEDMVDRLPATSPGKPFLESLLSDAITEVDSEPKGVNGAPHFIAGTDEIVEPEALLYDDDLTIQIGQVPALIKTLKKLQELSSSVCRLTVQLNNSVQFGTGFMIGSKTVLTNWHVLYDVKSKQQANNVLAEFKYEDDGAGGVVDTINIRTNVTTIRGSEQDDWAIIEVNDPIPEDWIVIELENGSVPVVGKEAFIIQHPGSLRKRLGFVRNQVSNISERVVHYLTDTQAGSSGAPVFNHEGKIFAIHHAVGRPQELPGRVPMAKNEGILISRVLKGLREMGIDVK